MILAYTQPRLILRRLVFVSPQCAPAVDLVVQVWCRSKQRNYCTYCFCREAIERHVLTHVWCSLVYYYCIAMDEPTEKTNDARGKLTMLWQRNRHQQRTITERDYKLQILHNARDHCTIKESLCSHQAISQGYLVHQGNACAFAVVRFYKLMATLSTAWFYLTLLGGIEIKLEAFS